LFCHIVGDMSPNIFSQIRQENQDFYYNSIEVVPGYTFNQYDTIKRIHLYLNSQFEDSTNYLGRDKLFFNVVNSPCEVAMRMLNIDTKNIRLYPTNPKSYFSTFLLEKELKQWLKTSKMGRMLNQIAEEAPRYGTVVIEKTKDGASLVDLRKLILDPTVERIGKSRFVTTVHYFTPSELRETGWDDVEVAIERFSSNEGMQSYEDRGSVITQMQSTPYIKVYKRYGEVPEWWLDGGTSEKMVKALFIVAGADILETNGEGKPVGELGVTLFKSKWHKEWPYKDFHYTKVKGRWMGLGIVEMLFDIQVRMNELKNQKRISMEISSMHLFTTPDKTIVRNALTDLQNGDILISPNGIQAVANEERNLPAFGEEEESYKLQADRLSFAFEAVTGAPLPSSTPATNALLANQSATSVYAFKRENVAIFLQEFFNDLVLPQLMKDLTPEHIMRFVGSAQELMKIDIAASEIIANDFIKSKILNGEVVTQEEVDQRKAEFIENNRKLGENRFLKIKQGLYKDAEFEFDFIIGNEQADPATLVQNTQTVFMAIAQNPMILQDPLVKMLFFKYAEQLGVSPAEIELAESQAAQLPANMQQNGQQPIPGQPQGAAQQSGVLPRAGQKEQAIATLTQ
jgi:hypothetical protein